MTWFSFILIWVGAVGIGWSCFKMGQISGVKGERERFRRYADGRAKAERMR